MRLHGIALLLCMILLAAAPALAQGTGAPSDERYDDAVRLYQEGQTDAAIYMLQQVEKDDPTNTKVLLKLGEMAIAQKNWAYAIEVLRKASKIRTDDVDSRLLLMDVYRAYQMPIQEIMVGREIVALNSRHAAALHKLAYLYHDQDMVDDEIRTRETLMAVDPADYENLRDLAHLYEKTGNAWEQALVLREMVQRFPDKKPERLELASAYGASLDWFNQMNTMDEATRHGVGVPHGMFSGAARAFRTELQLKPSLEGQARYERDVARQFRSDRNMVEAFYNYPFLRDNFDLGFGYKFSSLAYAGTDRTIGSRNMATSEYELRTTRWWNGNRTRLHLNAGLASVAVSGSMASRFGMPLSLNDFPFLENRRYGGEIITGLADFHHEFTPRLGMRVWAGRDLMTDTDAQARLITKSIGGAGFAYNWPDLSSAELHYEQWYVSDRNTMRNARLTLDRIFCGEEAVYDHHGARVNFVHHPPLSYLAVRYQGDWLDTSHDSAFYETFKGELEHQATLLGQAEIGKNTFLRGQAFYGFGNRVLKTRYGGNLGVAFHDVDEDNEVMVQYGILYDDIRPGSQVDRTLEGPSTFNHIQLSTRWHF